MKGDRCYRLSIDVPHEFRMNSDTPLHHSRSSPLPQVIQSLDEARQTILTAQRQGKRVGLVPTMGALHAGHLSLVEAARDQCDLVAVTIFVNPTQFAAHEDLDKYPRTLADDLEKLAEQQVELVFAPRDSDMYPAGCTTSVEPPRLAERWEGVIRPGHFRGVTTVVLKLFHIFPADIAFFGHKDYQQACVIRQMVADLNVPMTIQVCPTVRDPDGLALSSRNQYLDAEQRQQSLGLYHSLQEGARQIQEGIQDPRRVEQAMRDVLQQHGIGEIDYIGIADPETLEPQSTIHLPTILLLAARLGSTRLIDNWLVTGSGRPESK
jgi:pantoate--beta-alanine ligase